MKYLIGLFALIFLSGCTSWKEYQYARGVRHGKYYSKRGYNERRGYYHGFRTGFLIQNFNNIDEGY